MSRSSKDRQTSGRRKNEEEEPFLVKKISGSPIMRGKRQNSDEEHFVVENIPGSPVIRGKRKNFSDEHFVVENIPGSPVARRKRQNSDNERFIEENIPESSVTTRGKGQNSQRKDFLIQDISGSPVTRGPESRVTSTSFDTVDATSNASGWNFNFNDIKNSEKITKTPMNISVHGNHRNGPPDNEDAPPSYESSMPPNPIGWSPNVTATIPFPMPYEINHNEETLISTYPLTNTCTPIELSPLAKSYLSIESPNSRSPEPHVSPSLSPSPDRLRPAYTYQQRAICVPTTPTRRQFRREYEDNADFAVKPHDEFSYKYGGILITIILVIFIFLLSLAIKFILKSTLK